MRQEDHFEFKVSLNYILIVAIYLPGSGFRTFLGPLLLSDKWFSTFLMLTPLIQFLMLWWPLPPR